MKRNKIAMLLAMALTVTQSVAVPVAAEELTVEAGQEVLQDDSDADVTVEADEFASEDAEVNIQEDTEAVQSAEGNEANNIAGTELSDGTETQETFSDDAGEEEEKYELDYTWMDGHTGNGAMLPNSQMTIKTDLYWETSEDGGETDVYELRISSIKNSNLADISVQGKDLIVKSRNNIGYVEVSVEVLIDEQVVCTETVTFSINEYVIMPENVTDADGNAFNPKVGERIDIVKDMKPQLFRYEEGKNDLIPVNDDNIKIVIAFYGKDDETGENDYDYDLRRWKWIDVPGQELPILERTSGESTCFGLTAMEKDSNGEWYQIARRAYDLDQLPGYDDGDDGDDGDNGDHGNNTPMLRPDTLKDAVGNNLNPQVGETIDYAKKGVALYRYEEGVGGEDGKWYGVGDPETLKITMECEPDDWSVQYTEGWDVPTMTRKTKNATWIFFKAFEKDLETGTWNQIDSKRYEFDATDKVHSHSWVTKNVIKKATCTAAGSKVENCASCDATRTVTIPAKGHTVVKDAAVAPTVFADGKTEGSHCSVCGTVLEKQNTIAKVPGTIYLTASSLKMKTGQSTTAFKATGFSEGDYVTAVTSNKPGTVKVTNVNKNGTFKLTAGKKKGSAVVTVTLASKKTASFKVTVQKAAVKTTKITTTTKSLTLAKGATYKKLASSIAVTPVTSKEKVTYSSSNKKVATVSSKGVIKAKKAGTAKITVKSGKKKVIVTVKVTGVKTTNLSGVPAAKNVSKGKSFKIKAIATPKNTDEKITFKSSNKKVATVTSKGVVKGLKKGAATITVQSGSKKMTCKVTVK
ncbi:MAG: Ig-like domain-containing protein [Blautia sp.]|uniref:Ig-like domain-containing protein n=1 Tax=Blautia sp. TaxID=1955243 RepID=UPI00258D2D8E|nr:Ig-like domain-containing protein [Blautia sp.]MCI7289324.1 Ig-like domain-containing protein [Blautia sp.]